MLSDRERLQLTNEMIDAGRKMHAALQPPKNRAAVAAALASATAVVDTARGDTPSALGDLVDAIEKAMRAATASTTRGTLSALDDAVQDAHFEVQGMLALKNWRATYLGGGLRRVRTRLHDNRERQVYDVDMEELVDRFGPCLVSALFQLAAGANRVISLLHLLSLNRDEVKKDSVAYDRNFLFIGTSLLGYMMELSRVIDDLHTSEIAKKLSNPAPWVALRTQRKRWSHIRDFRNDIAFHLGWPEKTVPTIVDFAHKRAREIMWESDGDGTRSSMPFTTSFST
jgi:hypothetical protein